jgi:hypothetical protein
MIIFTLFGSTAKGKAKMVVLIALAHKILSIAAAIVKKREQWNPIL